MTLIGQTIAMIVFVWFCMKFIWPPLLEAIEERQQKIADGLAAADKGQERLEQASAEAESIISDARKQATGILDQAHSFANEIVSEGKSDGVKERERQLATAKAEIEQETNRAREELRGEVGGL
jgi:F-type H+-transporting ATPase subunit b